MSESKPDRTEMWKTLKWIVILLVCVVVSAGAYKAWQVASAPARVVGDAAGSLKSSASAVMNRLEVSIPKQRRFDNAATKAFTVLNALEETPPIGVKARGFRMTNFRGAQDRVCELSYDFGSGAIPVFVAADNNAHEAAKAIASDADRLIRIVIVSPEETLGLNAEYDETADKWTLAWRPSSLNKPYPDSWAAEPLQSILSCVPKTCGKAP